MEHRKSCGFLAVGDEILSGRITETLSAQVQKHLAPYFTRHFNLQVGDNESQILNALEFFSSQRTELLIISGGLGPTQDDLTRQAVGHFCGIELNWNDEAWGNIQERFAISGVSTIPEINKRQCYLPADCVPLRNDNGTAFGFLVQAKSQFSGQHRMWIACLPGVPYEFSHMLESKLIPALLESELVRCSDVDEHMITPCNFLIFGMGESAFEERLFALHKDFASLLSHYSICARNGLLEVTLGFRTGEFKDMLLSQIETEFRSQIVSHSMRPLKLQIADLLKEKHLKLAVLETSTFGELFSELSEVENSSEFLAGGFCVSNSSQLLRLIGEDAPFITADPDRAGDLQELFAARVTDTFKKFFEFDLLLINLPHGNVLSAGTSDFQSNSVSSSSSTLMSARFVVVSSNDEVFSLAPKNRVCSIPSSQKKLHIVFGKSQPVRQGICPAVMWSHDLRNKKSSFENAQRMAQVGLVGLFLYLSDL